MSRISDFAAALDGIAVSTESRDIRVKSRDHYALSPLLMKTLAGKQAEAVVSPASKAEVVAIAAAAVASGMALTPRGAGTANYGQSVPLHGGAMLDLSKLSGVLWVRKGAIRALAGTTIAEMETSARATGQELRFYPSTEKHATIGGFIAGGTGGIGSITWGVLRDAGNIRGVEVVSVEATPRTVELRGTDTRLVQHGYGTNGIITEVEMPLAPARDWLELVVAFPDYLDAIAFAVALGRATGITKKLASAYEWPIGAWIKPFRPFVPEGQSIALAMVASEDREAVGELIAEHGGTVVAEAPHGQGVYGAPLHEFVLGHTTLQVQKSEPRRTEVEGFFRAPDVLELVSRTYRKLAGIGPMRLEIRRWEGDLVCSGSPFIEFAEEAAVNDLVELMRAEGVRVANPHASNVRGVGKKEIGPREIAFKREMDPKGLLNPGRFEVDAADDTVVDKHLRTDGWLSSKAS